MLRRSAPDEIMLWFALLIVIYSYFEAQFIRVRRDTVFVEGLPPSVGRFTIIHISDLHSSRFGAREKRLCKILGEIDGDLAVFTGDYKARKRTNEEAVAEILQRVSACTRTRFGNIGVLGNKDNPGMVEGVERAGIEILSNSVKRLTLGKDDLWIAGIDALPLREATRALLSVTSMMPEKSLRILLSHGPDVMRLARALGYAVILAGDTHGGQIRLPLIGAPYVKSRVSRRYCWGIIKEGDSVLCVSSGIGTSGFPLRLLCPPEVRVLTLRGKAAQPAKEKILAAESEEVAKAHMAPAPQVRQT